MKKLLFCFLSVTGLICFAQVGIRTNIANSTLSIEGSFEAGYSEQSTAYALTINDHYVTYVGAADAIFTLPVVGLIAANSFSGRIYRIKNVSALGNVILKANGTN